MGPAVLPLGLRIGRIPGTDTEVERFRPGNDRGIVVEVGSAAWVWCLGLVLGSAAWVFLVVSNGRRQPMTESRHRDILDKTQRSKTAQRVRSRYQTKNRCGCAARRRLTKWSNAMATILWIIAVILVIAGIVALFRRQILWGIVLIVVGLLVGPGGVSLFT